jgi:hypothetical protein
MQSLTRIRKPRPLAEQSSSDNVGEALIQAGWRQGSLLPALAHLVLFDPEQPITNTAKAQRDFDAIAKPNERAPRYAFGGAAEKPAHRFIIISQTCDIAHELNVEPMVLAARVMYVRAGPVLNEARSSVRLFLLNEAARLVVDLRYVVQIEKPLLLKIVPERGAENEDVERRFRHWLGNRFNRPAFPDDFVQLVRDPMRERMGELARTGSPLVEVRRYLLDVRTLMPTTGPPYAVGLVALLEPTDDPAKEAALKEGAAALFGELFKGVNPNSVSSLQVQPILANEWPTSEFLATEPIDIDAVIGDE